MKKIHILILILVVAGVGFLFAKKYSAKESADYRNIEYKIAGESVKLVDGVSEVEIPGSASKVVTRYFGNQAKGDLNGDGIPDLAFLLTQETGGSGTFFYVVGAIQNADNTYRGTDAVLLGDRIAPQTTEIRAGKVIVNFAERKPGEPMTADPSVGKSIWLLLNKETMQFGEVAQNFEGEADPSRMTLDMKTWVWTKALFNDGKQVTPKSPGKFTLTFKKDGTFSASTDCNGVGGEYGTKESAIVFENMMSTLMYCEGSQESVFRQFLQDSASYHFTSKGELILDLKYDSGSIVFN